MYKSQFNKIFLLSIIGFFYRSLSNLVKPLIGASPYHGRTDHFIKRYLIHLLSFKRVPLKFSLTSEQTKEAGPGGQALAVIYAISFSQFYGFGYLHTRFHHIAHADRPMNEWAKAWENYFNLGHEETLTTQTNTDCINFGDIDIQLAVIYKLDDTSQLFKNSLPSIKRKYWHNKTKIEKADNVMFICIHVRRGDVSATKHEPMYTGTEYVLQTIEQLTNVLDTMQFNYELHLFSQGNQDQFKSLEGFNIVYHLDEDAISSHAQLVNADILITATNSTFSYTAALLCDGIILFEKIDKHFIFSALDGWVLRKANGCFNSVVLQQKLADSNYASYRASH